MIGSELQKLLSPLRVTILLLLFIAKCVCALLPFSYDIGYSKAVYREYMHLLEGQTAAQAAAWIETEAAWIEASLGTENTEEMGVSEQFAAMENLAEAQRKADAFAAVYEKYLQFGARDDTENPPIFFYDLEWAAFLDNDAPDWILLLVIAVIIPYFTADCGSIRSMLFAARHGRRKLIRTKLLLAAALILFAAVLLQIAELLCFAV